MVFTVNPWACVASLPRPATVAGILVSKRSAAARPVDACRPRETRRRHRSPQRIQCFRRRMGFPLRRLGHLAAHAQAVALGRQRGVAVVRGLRESSRRLDGSGRFGLQAFGLAVVDNAGPDSRRPPCAPVARRLHLDG